MKSLRIVLACILTAVLLTGMCACTVADELTDDLNQPVPFGIAHTDTGAGISVYRSTTARTASDTLSDYQVCAILDFLTYNNANWYKIRYVSGDALKEGYIREDGFYQLTVAGLISLASDASSSAALKMITNASNPNVLMAQATPTVTAVPTPTPKPTKKATMTPSPTPKATKKATATPASARKRYVLNTKTMKFHLPSCSEADKTTPENKKTTITTRESLIDQGYTPCQKCKP